MHVQDNCIMRFKPPCIVSFNCLRNLTSFSRLEMTFLSRKESEIFCRKTCPQNRFHILNNLNNLFHFFSQAADLQTEMPGVFETIFTRLCQSTGNVC